MSTRRAFMQGIVLAGSAAAMARRVGAGEPPAVGSAPLNPVVDQGSAETLDAGSDSGATTHGPIAVFEKPLEGLAYDGLAKAVGSMELDGIEATIRPGGHIEPAKAIDEVPKMAQALAAVQRRIVIAATAIADANDPLSERVLTALLAAGVTHYRMAHLKYDLQKPLMPQMRSHAARCRDLAALNQQLGIQGLYQNHAGIDYAGALGWDAAMMLDGIDPSFLGMALDLRHLRIEAGLAWKQSASAVLPHVRSIYLKDAMWQGPRGNQPREVPLDQGIVTKEVFDFVRAAAPSPLPMCLHIEHIGYRRFEPNEIDTVIAATRGDVATLRRWLSDG
jgi:hypothetical protein